MHQPAPPLPYPVCPLPPQVVLGLATAWEQRAEAGIWPVACFGPLACFTLCSKARGCKWMENLGEVALMGSVVYLQSVLHPVELQL